VFICCNEKEKDPVWKVKVKIKQSHNRPSVAQKGSRRFRLPDFQDTRHMKVVKLSALCTGRLYPQEMFLVLIFARGFVDPRAIVGLEGLCH
jgi:hypothetical protein